MPIFIPPYLGEEIKSNAERKMFSVLQDLQLKNAYILHSLGLPRHQSKIYGEIDFVVVCERGVACLEIKGGRVECREGRWYFTDRYGNERQKMEGPFAQVTGNMFSLRDVIKNRFKNDPHVKDLLMACGVVFPDIEFTSTSQEIIREITFDSTTKDITEYLNHVFDYWEGRAHCAPSKLPPTLIKEIVQYLRGDFTFIPTLSNRLNEVEERLVHLTSQQARVMEALSANTHLLIEGNAGTGKTLLALDFARKKASQGKKVLYLAYNKNLTNNLQHQLSDEEKKNLKIRNLHALFGEYVSVNVKKMKINPQEYFNKTFPEECYDYLNALPDEEREYIQYDLFVVDEGQDIIKPEYLFNLDLLLKKGLEQGEWAVFYDEKQNIYNPDYQEGMEILKSYNSTSFQLFVNCRNTIQIGTYSCKASGVAMTDFLSENGEEVCRITADGIEATKKEIQGILKNLKQEKVDMKDVVFLSPKRYAGSCLAKCEIPVNEIADMYDPSVNLPKYGTIQGFKGLDAKIVILVDADDITDNNFSRFIYIASTRARTLLYIVGSKEFWEHHKVD